MSEPQTSDNNVAIFLFNFFMSDDRKKLGNFGEKLVISFLRNKGYKIIETNWRTQVGEIDIVCKKGGKIIFVEVRTKSNSSFCSPEESVGPHKKQKLAQMAELYMQSKKLYHCEFGVDGVFIEIKNDVPEILHLENILEI